MRKYNRLCNAGFTLIELGVGLTVGATLVCGTIWGIKDLGTTKLYSKKAPVCVSTKSQNGNTMTCIKHPKEKLVCTAIDSRNNNLFTKTLTCEDRAGWKLDKDKKGNTYYVCQKNVK